MLFEALLGQTKAVAGNRPVLTVFEDAHGIDPTSREFLDLTLDRVGRLPVLLVVTFRPEFQQGVGRSGARDDAGAQSAGWARGRRAASVVVGELREKVPSVRLDLSKTGTCGSIPRSWTSQFSISAEP